MNSTQKCFTLYPYGTLGRVFINIALEFISTLEPLSIEYSFDTVCIKNEQSLIKAINSIKGLEEPKTGFFPLTGNDARSLSSRLWNFDPRNLLSILDYIASLIKAHGYNVLETKITAPLIMRVELYEYTKEGYAQHRKTTQHPYRDVTVLNLGLAVIGSLITHVATIRVDDDVRYYYFIPLLKNINLDTIYRLKSIIDGSLRIYINQGKALGAVTTFKVALSIFKTGLLNKDTTIGELITISTIGKRFSLLGRELLDTCGWIWLFSRLGRGSIKTLESIVSVIDATMRKTQYKSLSPMYGVIDELFRYVQCEESALYRAVRLLNIAVDVLKRAEKSKKISEEWEIVYKQLSVLELDLLVRDLGSLAEETPCQRRITV